MFDLSDYSTAITLLPRLLGAIYFFAFGAFLFQIRGLIGKNGIEPINLFLIWVKRHLPRKCYIVVPSVFWLWATDTALMVVTGLGTLISLLLVLGIWPTFLLAILYVLYLSIISVGQDFLGFGWEGFLQEVVLHAIMLSLAPNIFVWISLNMVLFRFHFQAGVSKLQSRDPNWRNVTGVAYHYQSQPIPNLISWYIHKMPLWFHKLSCVLMFIGEIGVPFLIFFGQDLRFIAFIMLLGLQLFIWATGNFSFLNHLTVALLVILVSNKFIGQIPTHFATPSLVLDSLFSVFGIALLLLQLARLWDNAFPHAGVRQLLNSLSYYHIANRYGIFAVMTTIRYEIVVEGSMDGQSWKEYYFYHKPTELQRRPRRISPYQPRLDWQAWFLPFRGFETQSWFQSFLRHLLLGTPEVVSLLKHNPFPAHPPKLVRALMYVYEFTSFKEKKETGAWWKRKLIGHYTPELLLRS